MKIVLDAQEKEAKRLFYRDVVVSAVRNGIIENLEGKIRANSFNEFGGWVTYRLDGETTWIKVEPKNVQEVILAIVCDETDVDSECEAHILHAWKRCDIGLLEDDDIESIFRVLSFGWENL